MGSPSSSAGGSTGGGSSSSGSSGSGSSSSSSSGGGSSSSSSSSSSGSSGSSSSGGSSSSSRGGGGADSGSSAGANFSRSVADAQSGRGPGGSSSSDDDNDSSSTSNGTSTSAGSPNANGPSAADAAGGYFGGVATSYGAPALDGAPAEDDSDNRSTSSSGAQMDEEANYSVDTSSLSRNTPADPGLTPSQSTSLADSAAVMDGYAFSPADVAPPANDDVAEEEGFVDRATDAVVGTGQLVGGVAVGAVETAWDGVVGAAGLAWEGVNMVNDAAGTVLDTAVGWTGIDAFEGHSQRNAERGQAMIDTVKSLPDVPGKIADSVEQGWETFEDNWETGNYYEAGKQIGGVGLEVASIAVPAAKAGSLGKLSKVDDLAPAAGAAARTADDLPDTVFRGDTRPPGEIFGPGFEPRGTATDLQDYAQNNTPSNYVSTSVAKEEAETFATQFGTTDGYVYSIDTKRTGGIDVNATLGPDSPYPHEREIAIPGGVPGDAIKGATPINRNSEYGNASILNPDYYSGPR